VARSGRLVVDRIQTLTAPDGTVSSDVSLGAPAPADSWYFADGRVDAGTVERFVVFNPGERIAEASLTLLTGAGGVARGEPFELRLPPGTATEVTLNHEPRVPEPLLHATLVQAEGDVPIVAERVLLTGGFIDASPGVPGTAAPPEGSEGAPTTTEPSDANGTAGTSDTTETAAAGSTAAGTDTASGVTLPPLPAGFAASIGEPVVATRWVVALPASAPTAEGAPGTGGTTTVTILNPSGSGRVDLTVDAIGPSGRRTVKREGVDAARRTEFQVPFGAESAYVVDANAPVVVGRSVSFADPPGFGADAALPQVGTLSIARLPGG
jgi:hypothetical protein